MSQNKELKLIKTLWGIDDPISPTLLKSVQADGYHGIEVIRLAWTLDKDVLLQSLNESGLAVVCQMHTTGGYLDEEGGYIYCGKYDVSAHQEDFRKQLKECCEFIGAVKAGGFINVHAGVDAWHTKDKISFLQYCQEEIEQMVPSITVTFETHRQRIFGSPFETRDLLNCDAISKIKLNADLSHWYCACERVFNEKDDRDKWWPDLLKQLSPRCEYIHARLGWAQGPQMADPSAPECEAERNLQVSVWKMLMQDQVKRRECIFASPEYGPPPYMPVKPHSQEPVASLPSAVTYTKRLLEDLHQTLS